MTLSDWMRARDLRDLDMAAMLGVSAVSIWRYRTGARRPAWPILERIRAITDGEVTAADFHRPRGGRRPLAGGRGARAA